MHTLYFELQADGNPQDREKEVHAAFSQLCEHFPEWRTISVTDIRNSTIPESVVETAIAAGKDTNVSASQSPRSTSSES